MSNSNFMAQRPPLHSAPSSRAFSPPMSASSPNAPSPGSIYPPPPKRQRVSPNPQSPPYGSPSFQDLQLPSVGSPINGFSALTAPGASTPVGTMGPPSKPADRDFDKEGMGDAVKSAGVDIEAEQALHENPIYRPSTIPLPAYGQSNQPGSSFESYNGMNGLYGSNAPLYGGEDLDELAEAREGWKAGSRHQYHLADPFLTGEALERMMHNKAQDHSINTPKEGLYHATQGRPPQRTQVVAPDDSAEVIDKGQTILSTEGKSLVNLMNLVSLACRERLTCFVDHAARLAYERRNFSMGRLPSEWQNWAIVDTPAQNETETTSPQSTSLKRTQSQANSGDDPRSKDTTLNRMADLFRKVSAADRLAEEARLAKRAKRKNVVHGDGGGSTSVSTPGPSTPVATLSEPEKRPTKKAQKAADAKFTEQQQQKSANETVRLATSGMGANRFGKKKSYNWLNTGAKTVPSAATSNSNINLSLEDDAVPRTTPVISRPPAVRPVKQFGEWNEEIDKRGQTIGMRDILLVLEADGKAARTLTSAYNLPEERD